MTLEMRVEKLESKFNDLISLITDLKNDKVTLQKRRSDLTSEICNLEDSGKADNVACKRVKKELEDLPKVFDNEEIQDILDCFHWDYCEVVSYKLGYTYGVNSEEITQEILIKSAIDLFEELESDSCKSGRLQRGRLIVNKFWDEEEDRPWYTMQFFIENGEAY